jgi:hypothetical protein
MEMVITFLQVLLWDIRRSRRSTISLVYYLGNSVAVAFGKQATKFCWKQPFGLATLRVRAGCCWAAPRARLVIGMSGSRPRGPPIFLEKRELAVTLPFSPSPSVGDSPPAAVAIGITTAVLQGG